MKHLVIFFGLLVLSNFSFSQVKPGEYSVQNYPFRGPIYLKENLLSNGKSELIHYMKNSSKKDKTCVEWISYRNWKFKNDTITFSNGNYKIRTHCDSIFGPMKPISHPDTYKIIEYGKDYFIGELIKDRQKVKWIKIE